MSRPTLDMVVTEGLSGDGTFEEKLKLSEGYLGRKHMAKGAVGAEA